MASSISIQIKGLSEAEREKMAKDLDDNRFVGVVVPVGGEKNPQYKRRKKPPKVK